MTEVRRTITIDPVTRIEGHARVLLDLDEKGDLASACLVVNELRGFEKILVGMEADRMPLVTGRICGVCPAAHHLAAAKALDAAAGIEPPPAAKLLRELLYMGHFIHSHTLSVFVLEGPDLVLGLDADPADRNIVGVVKAAPEVAKKALRLRTLGQKVCEMVGGRGTHPVTAVAGGMAFRPDSRSIAQLSAWVDEACGLALDLAPVAKTLVMKMLDSHPALADFWEVPSWSLGTVRDGKLDLYDGRLRMVDEKGDRRGEWIAGEYDRYLVEKVVDWSYMKPVVLRHSDTTHAYRVGPLSRVNCSDGMATPLADAELEELRRRFGAPCHLTVVQPWARVIELVYTCERAREILADPGLTGPTRVPVKFSGGRGVGHVEAPRGTLFHDYVIDDTGVVREANLLVATQQNYELINQSILQAARSHVQGGEGEPLLNAVEFAIRNYDPCLSCATHALGTMPLQIEIRRPGRPVSVAKR